MPLREYGWIKIHRSLIANWIWNNPEYLKWWLDLLFMAEWRTCKCLLLQQRVTLQRGQLAASVRFLADRWRNSSGKGKKGNSPSTKKILHFLKLLESDGSITRDCKTLPRNTGLITIVNYSKYQALVDDGARMERDTMTQYLYAVDEPVVPDGIQMGPVCRSSGSANRRNDKRGDAKRPAAPRITATAEDEARWFELYFSPSNNNLLLPLVQELNHDNPEAMTISYMVMLGRRVMDEWRLNGEAIHQDYNKFARHLLGQIRKKNKSIGNGYSNKYRHPDNQLAVQCPKSPDIEFMAAARAVLSRTD